MAQQPQPYGADYGKEFEEISDDSDDELEIAVDAIHPRLSTTYYSCVKCKVKFDSKKSLYLHFESGCYIKCRKCGIQVYERFRGGKGASVRKCSKRCNPDLS